MGRRPHPAVDQQMRADANRWVHAGDGTRRQHGAGQRGLGRALPAEHHAPPAADVEGDDPELALGPRLGELLREAAPALLQCEHPAGEQPPHRPRQRDRRHAEHRAGDDVGRPDGAPGELGRRAPRRCEDRAAAGLDVAGAVAGRRGMDAECQLPEVLRRPARAQVRADHAARARSDDQIRTGRVDPADELQGAQRARVVGHADGAAGTEDESDAAPGRHASALAAFLSSASASGSA